MNDLALGHTLPAEEFEEVRRSAIFECGKWDIQCEDHSVLAPMPVLLGSAAWRGLAGFAEALTTEALAAEEELLTRLDLHANLGVPRPICDLWKQHRDSTERTTGPRVMRFDFHLTAEGWKISEVNADVPGGFLEASGVARIVGMHYEGWRPAPDPVMVMADAVLTAAHGCSTVALVHATAYADDREVMQYIGRQLQARGTRTVLLSPAHLSWETGLPTFRCRFAHGTADAVVRFFPADWLPELRNPAVWTGYFWGSRAPVSNPGSALLIQSKRFPLVWDALHTSLPTWRHLLPETICASRLNGHSVADWVLKPVLGRAGEGVVMDGITSESLALRMRNDARKHPRAWIAQRRFESLPVSCGARPFHVCIGVFTVNGVASGAYGRISERALIDEHAQDAAVLLPVEGSQQ